MKISRPISVSSRSSSTIQNLAYKISKEPGLSNEYVNYDSNYLDYIRKNTNMMKFSTNRRYNYKYFKTLKFLCNNIRNIRAPINFI